MDNKKWIKKETEITEPILPESFNLPKHHGEVYSHSCVDNSQPELLMKQECKEEIDIVEHELPETIYLPEHHSAVYLSEDNSEPELLIKQECKEETDIVEHELPGMTLQKRWKNLRDCFTRELRRLKDVKSGSAAKRKSHYTYFNQLLFLRSVLDTNAIENSLEEASQENESARSSDLETQQSASKSLRTKRKKKIPNEESDTDPLISVLHKAIATIEKTDDSNCDRLFLLSLLDRFQNIPAVMKTKAKMEIMEIIEKYQPNYEPTARINYSRNFNTLYDQEYDPHRPNYSSYSTTNRISDDSNYSDTHTHYSDISQNSEMIDLFPNLND
ncbi:uncharacterized protein LOC126968331 isoform X4 [Leptidea sinapis]|uniref:uncharacterized protein LOC126968331 isoform X4 n=1 Tax=Leptidea sinapis TaxID=189913 RepID=UPI00213046E4|nr:uncharacterized protein LOC126968331 isoform X4 [Leptidea sinapis]